LLNATSKHIFVIVLILSLSQVFYAQEFRSSVAISTPSAPVNVDLSSISGVAGASITIRNSSGSYVNLPQVSNPGTPWPYNFAAIKQQLPPTSSDQELAIATWRFVITHTSHYCSSGTKTTAGLKYLTDPALILNSFGFGCCDQKARLLTWIWQNLGYQTRLATMTFHTLPEIYYGNAWHVLDSDHESFYLNADGSIASIAQILADPNIVIRQASSTGTDGVGWSAALMSQLYTQNASSLRYVTSGFLSNQGLSVSLHPHEELVIHGENLAGAAQFYDSGDPFSFKTVGSGQFNWDLSFADAGWRSWPSSTSNVDVFSDPSGTKYLAPATNAFGWLYYRESVMFPLLGLSVAAQSTPNKGNMYAYVSSDGAHWSPPVPFTPTVGVSGYQLSADLSAFAKGNYIYYVAVQISTGSQLHRLRISPVVQMSKWIFPALGAGSVSQLTYSDASPAAQARRIEVTTRVPTGNPEIRGLQAESLVTESPTSSLARDYGAANLVDGNPDTLAYPGNPHIDYVIHLGGMRNVTSVSIDWGTYGSNPLYVKSWSLQGRFGSQAWQVLASGGFPGQSTVDILANATASDLRIVADGFNNLGIYDVRVFGSEMPAVPKSNLSVVSNVTEDPIHSIAAGYAAANLIDGNATSLAYPSNNHFDYQVSLTTPTHLSAALITWGAYGANPIYVTSWSLLGRNGSGQPWSILAQGGNPGSISSGVNLDAVVTDLRMVAASTHNSIGIYELGLFAAPASGLPLVDGVIATSNVLDVTTLFGYGPAANLVDGNETTRAFPFQKSLDYTLDPGGLTFVESVRVVWGHFGQDPNSVASWRLLGLRQGAIIWEVITSGGFPNASETSIPVKNSYRKLRIAAESQTNASGIYEVQVFGQQ
jgi:hypothetical protein